MLLLFTSLLLQANEPEPPEPPQAEADQFRPPVVGRGPGTTISATDMRRQAQQRRRRVRRQREDMLFL